MTGKDVYLQMTWHEVDQTKHEIFCVHIVCNEIQVKVNLEITTFFFYLRFPYCPNFFWFGVVVPTVSHVYFTALVEIFFSLKIWHVLYLIYIQNNLYWIESNRISNRNRKLVNENRIVKFVSKPSPYDVDVFGNNIFYGFFLLNMHIYINI